MAKKMSTLNPNLYVTMFTIVQIGDQKLQTQI